MNKQELKWIEKARKQETALRKLKSQGEAREQLITSLGYAVGHLLHMKSMMLLPLIFNENIDE